MSDLYMEGEPNNVYLAGNDGDIPGRVTIQGPKFQRGGEFGKSNPAAVFDNYNGEFSIVLDDLADPIQNFVAKGNNPLSILLLGDYFYEAVVSLKGGANAKFHCLANEGSDCKTIGFDCPPTVKDTDFEAAAPQAARAFDDLRRLGEVDLRLNHPGVLEKQAAR